MAAVNVKKILLACGTGICTSTAAANKLKTELDKKGKAGLYTITQCKIAETVSKSEGADLIVATTTVPNGCKCPVVMGLPFLTGIGMDKTVDQCIEILGI